MQDRSDFLDFALQQGGEMGARIRAFDWASTSLGSIETWPQSLRTIVCIMLTSRQPIWIAWGADLIKLYNDPYKTIVGGKHPAALGQPASVVWQDIWSDIAPMLQQVMEHNQGTYVESQLLLMERYGYTEETYYTFSYNPVLSEYGGVGGMICTNTDDTQRVIGERQLALLRSLAADTAEAKNVEEAARRATSSLERNPYDIPFALLYLADPGKQIVHLAKATNIPSDHPAAPHSVIVDSPSVWPFQEVLQTGQASIVTVTEETVGQLPTGAWSQPAQQVVVMPIAPAGETGQPAVLIVGLNPFRQYDLGYQGFLNLVAGQVASSLSNAHAYEEERKRAAALAEIDRAKTLFFSNVSHEFRTPLTLMLGPIEEALQDPQTLPANRERLDVAHRNALRLLKLVNTLLDFSRIEAGRAQAVFQPTDLTALTADLTSVFRSAVERAGLELVVETSALSEPVYVDPEMWEKIVLNLLSNAFKYTLEGSIAVRLYQADGHVELKVSDTGIGIPAEELPLIFDRFHRVRDSRARSHEGTGIGLSLVQELVALHGGTIRVESNMGQGSTFIVSLPLGIAHLPAAQIEGERKLSSTAISTASYLEEASRWLGDVSDGQIEESISPSDFPADRHQETYLPISGARILIADDNADMRDYLTRLLRRYWEVEAVADGEAALKAAKAQLPDLVVTDVMMPGMDGFALLRALRDDPALALIPVVMLSARAGEEASIEGLTAGANDYLIKPFSAKQLMARVYTQLQVGRIQRGMEELYAVSQQMALASSPEELLASLHSSSFLKAGVSAGFFWYNQPWAGSEPEYGEVVANWSLDPHAPDLTGVRFNLKEFSLTNFSSREKPVLVADIESDSRVSEEARAAQRAVGGRSFITIPLITNGVCRGYCYVLWGDVHYVSEEDLRTIQSLVDQAAAALSNMLALKSEAEARQSAEKANALKTRFLAMISHELRTPLSSIKGFASTLLQKEVVFDPDNQQEFIGIINDEADKLTNLIEQLLEVSRMQAGTFTIQAVPVSVREIIESGMAQLKTLTANHPLTISIPDRLPRVQADKLRIEQVISNLVGNAAKYTPPGTQVHISAKREDSFIRVDVSDQGPGIPPEEKELVFEAFHQIGSTTHHDKNGLGLGLAISRSIIEAHSGRIWVEESKSPGTTISFTLPVASDSWKDRL